MSPCRPSWPLNPIKWVTDMSVQLVTFPEMPSLQCGNATPHCIANAGCLIGESSLPEGHCTNFLTLSSGISSKLCLHKFESCTHGQAMQISQASGRRGCTLLQGIWCDSSRVVSIGLDQILRYWMLGGGTENLEQVSAGSLLPLSLCSQPTLAGGSSPLPTARSSGTMLDVGSLTQEAAVRQGCTLPADGLHGVAMDAGLDSAYKACDARVLTLVERTSYVLQVLEPSALTVIAAATAGLETDKPIYAAVAGRGAQLLRLSP